MRISLVGGFESFSHKHWVAMVIVSGVCAWISLCLIARMWLTQRRESVLKLVFWTFALTVPFFGWVMYGGFFRPPDRLSSPNPRESAFISGGGSAL